MWAILSLYIWQPEWIPSPNMVVHPGVFKGCSALKLTPHQCLRLFWPMRSGLLAKQPQQWSESEILAAAATCSMAKVGNSSVTDSSCKESSCGEFFISRELILVRSADMNVLCWQGHEHVLMWCTTCMIYIYIYVYIYHAWPAHWMPMYVVGGQILMAMNASVLPMQMVCWDPLIW